MAEQEKPKTIFYSLSQSLRSNKKDIPSELSKTSDLLTSDPDANFIQNQQQRFADFQTLKIAQDLYSRSMYFDSDRISAYNDYRAMDQTPEISVALDIMSDECLAFDTIIPLLNGEKKTIEELHNENKVNFWVYSYNIKSNKIEPAICEKVVYKGEQEVYEVVFDDDSSIKATGQHLWLLKNSKEYVETKSLKLGDSIQPFYSRISTKEDRICGYEMLLCDNGKWEYTHRIVKNKIYSEEKGVCHHVDFNKLNNSPDNLRVMNYFDHQKLHASLNSERWKDEKFSEKMKKIFSKTNSKDGPYWTNEAWAEKRRESARKHMVHYCSGLTNEEKKIRFGLIGEKNGMYANGNKLSGKKNGRYLHDLNHEFVESEVINAFEKTSNIDEACVLLNTNKVILRKSQCYKNLNINRWEDLNIITNNLSLDKIKKWCEYHADKIILERSLNLICNELQVKPKLLTKFLTKIGYKHWTEYVKQFDSKNQNLQLLKTNYLNTPPNKFGKISLRYFAEYNQKSAKQIESFLTRTKYENWTKFTNSINHSIKKITLIGKVKTYDLVNVTENNNYAVLTTNGTGVFVHNCVSRSDKGEILEIYSEDARIKRVLKDLFHGTLNVNYNLWFWIRTLLKYGDNFLKLEIDQKMGVYNITQLPTGEIHKEIGYDGNPYSVRFKWDINNMYFEDFQIAHFSLMSDGEKVPYGRSVLDSIRKLWKQLQLAEDAMLVYRLVRAPERRMFFIDVGNTDTPDVRQYIEKIKAELKKSSVVDTQGRVNMKFNLITFEEDFFIPVRGDKTGTRVETLPGACLALDTRIPLLDGRTLTLQEIINEWDNDKKLEAYSINPVTGEIVPGSITWAGVTRKNTQVLKVTLDNGEIITCTPDHKFPTRFNGKKEAKDLEIGESLWSFNKKFEKIFNRKKAKKYEMIYDHEKNDWKYTHRMVAEYTKKNAIVKEHIFDIKNTNKPKNVIHHYNFKHTDNSSDNLYYMNYHDHVMLHQSFSKDYLLQRNEGIKEYWNNISEENFNKKVSTAIKNFKKGSEKLQELLKDKNYKKDFYLKTSASLKINKNTEENKTRQSKYSKANWENTDFRNAVIEKQSIKYSERMLQFVVKHYNNGLSAEEILNKINMLDSEFMIEFNLLNNKNSQLKKMKNGFTHNNLYKMMKHFGYDNWRDFKNKVEYFNHKIVSIEWLEEKQDTGTITIDGPEQFHDFHNFALACGVFTSNSNLGDIMDIEYLQNKLFTGIKVPKTYLNYGEALPGGSTLSQADLRFARTINRFQEAVILELRNIANIHLKLLGFDDDINNFTITLTNPSTQQELLKLETMKARLDVFKEMFSSDATAPVSYSWAMEFILGFSKSEIKQILRQKKVERKMFYEIERAHEEYMDTGFFTELDKKFRKPDFDPNTQINPDEEGVGGDDSAGGGGGFGGFGGGSSFGLGDTDTAGMDALGADSGGAEAPGLEDAGEVVDTGAEETEPEEMDNLKENLLLTKNKIFDHKTKNILENINNFLTKINKTKEE